MKAIIRTFALVFIIFNCLTACTNLSSKTKLYDQLGGTAGITHIVDNLLYELSSNDQVLPLFTNTDIARFRQKMIEKYSTKQKIDQFFSISNFENQISP